MYEINQLKIQDLSIYTYLSSTTHLILHSLMCNVQKYVVGTLYWCKYVPTHLKITAMQIQFVGCQDCLHIYKNSQLKNRLIKMYFLKENYVTVLLQSSI